MLYEAKDAHIQDGNEKGAGFAQYALILALVVIVAVTVLQQLGIDITATFQSVVDVL